MKGRIEIRARARHQDQIAEIIVRGQTARTLKALVDAGPRGITALEVSSWALRLAAYCHDLIHLHGLEITTEREAHEEGRRNPDRQGQQPADQQQH